MNTAQNTTYNLKVKGDSARSEVEVYLDDLLYMEMVVNFSREPAKFSEIKQYTLNFYVDVVGMKESEAVKALNEANYNNVEIVYEKSTYEAGVVINQSPSYSSAPHIDNTAKIVLTVSKGLVDTPETEVDASDDVNG